jgi:hypothetical protein
MLLNSSMASKVNLWTVPVEDFPLLGVVTTGTEGLVPFGCTATFSPRVSVRDCTKQFWEVKANAPVAWACWLRRSCGRASETLACPTSAKQNDKIALQEAVSVRNNSSTRGRPRGLCPWFQLCSGQRRETCRGPIKATRSGTLTQHDAWGSGWSHFVTVARGVRPWLPQFGRPAPGHARLASLRIAHDSFPRAAGSHGSAWPSRRYRSSTA